MLDIPNRNKLPGREIRRKSERTVVRVLWFWFWESVRGEGCKGTRIGGMIIEMPSEPRKVKVEMKMCGKESGKNSFPLWSF